MKKFHFNIKDPRIRVPILVTLLVGGGIYYWYTQFFQPLQVERDELTNQLKAKKDTLRIVQALKPQVKQLRQEVIAAQEKLDSLKSIFPDQKEIPKLIREITSVARASGITTTKFNPLPDVMREYYVENRYSVTVEGGYHDLAEFFAFLANFTLIINLSSMHIDAHPSYHATGEGENEFSTLPSVKSFFEMTTFSSKK